jgi:hypothetical protein
MERDSRGHRSTHCDELNIVFVCPVGICSRVLFRLIDPEDEQLSHDAKASRRMGQLHYGVAPM